MHNRIIESHFFFTCVSHSPWFCSLPFLITFSVPSCTPLLLTSCPGASADIPADPCKPSVHNPRNLWDREVGAAIELHRGLTVDLCSSQFSWVKEMFSNSLFLSPDWTLESHPGTSPEFCFVLTLDYGNATGTFNSTLKTSPKDWSTLRLHPSCKKNNFL